MGRHRARSDADGGALGDLLEHLLDVLVFGPPNRLGTVRTRVDRPPIDPQARRPARPHDRLVLQVHDRNSGRACQAVALGQARIAALACDLLHLEAGEVVGKPHEGDVTGSVAEARRLPAPVKAFGLDPHGRVLACEARASKRRQLAGP